ncbi:hypothetical protein Bra1253DRAFT_05245 [Bradyrhizobium sp. WSM1253]|nr:hypothetical protein Bra1253DRAFT_05245 [Bradyrhizobium sp. WSM1253]
MDAESAATRRQGSKQCLRIAGTRPTNEGARVDRRPMAARMQCFRLMKAPCRFYLRNPSQIGPPAHQRISVPFSFRPQMHQPVCPQRVYAERHNHYNKVLLPHNRMTNRNMAAITSKRAGSTMTATTLRMDAPVDDLDLLGSQIGIVEMVRESVLARATCSGDHRSDNLSQLPIYPDGKMMELARTASSFACCGPRVRETGGYFGNDGAFLQRFPVRAVGRRL